MAYAPATLLQVVGGKKSFGARELFHDLSFAVNEGEHVGVIGPNGAGKTTLFKVIVGETELESGKVIRSGDLRLGYLAQHDTWNADTSVEDYLVSDAAGGIPVSMPIWDMKSLGRGLGLSDDIFDRKIASLSGGYRMRVKLLRLLGQEPNVMLLDEPTNYLDLETLLVLEDFLTSSKGAFLLISHDREFLRRTTDHILEVEAGETTKYPGSIDDYFEQKELLRTQLESRAMALDAKRQTVLDFAARFGAKATKARQVQSRLKSLDRMETIELKALPVKAKMRIQAPARMPKMVLEMRDAVLGYPGKTIFPHLDLQIQAGDRVGVVGYNGAGKSTLLKSLAAELPLQGGSIEFGYEVKASFYGQHVTERLRPNATVFEELESVTGLETSRQEIMDMAGSLLFSGNDTQKKVSLLSGGEKSRVALGQVLLRKRPLLLLDEPTNHLDFYTVEALTQALETYTGSLLVVSHDRSFVQRVSSKILEVRDGKAQLYPGNYDDYVWSLTKGVLGGRRANAGGKAAAKSSKSPEPAKATDSGARASGVVGETSPSTSPSRRRGEIDQERRKLTKEIERLQRQMDAANEELHRINGALPTADSSNATRLLKEMAEHQGRLADAETRWLEASERDQNLATELRSLGFST